MWIFTLLSIIAAVQFHRTTQQRGYHSLRFALYPIIVGNGLLLFTYAAKWIFSTAVGHQDSPWQKIHGPVIDLLALIALFTLLAKAWKQIQQLPPR